MLETKSEPFSRKIRLLLSYDGTGYQGWQKQPGHLTIQGMLEDTLTQLYAEPIRIIGSGRTDAGTHAVGQVAHYKAPKIFRGEDKLVRGLNALLPPNISVKKAFLAPTDFHAMISAKRKTYIYKIWNHPVRSALWHQRALWMPYDLDLKLLNQLAAQVVGERDFKSFQSTGTPVKTTVRHIYKCEWVKRSGPQLELHITGSGFLKQMVRNLVGTMLYLERRKRGIREFREIFEAHDRQAAKATAAAHGLYLYRVQYPRTLDNKCVKL